MTNRERIRILEQLNEWPIHTIDEKLEQVSEALNRAIKICNKYESRRKDTKK